MHHLHFLFVCAILMKKQAVIVNPPEVVEVFQRFLNDIQGRYEEEKG